MQQTTRLSTLLATSLLLALGTAGSAAAAPENGAGTTTHPTLVRAQSISGAYLAAQSAQIDGDLAVATEFYRQALALDPTSELLQQDAMLAFLAEGNLAEGVDLAAKLRDNPDSGKVARIALGVDALRRGNYDSAIEEFAIDDPSDLDALLLGQLSAWAELGRGNVDKALSQIDQLQGAPWFSIFNDYQKGLIADVAGRPEVARKAWHAVIDDAALARTSPDAYLAAAEALARLEAREGKKKEALAAIDTGLQIAPTYDPLVILKSRIEKGETIEQAVGDVQEGSAETLYILGQAINRGDGQQVALLYFQLARGLAPRNPALLTAMAGIAERSQRLDQAIDYYRQIPENSAFRRTADLQIGLDLWTAEKKDEARKHLQRAIKDYPKDVQAYTALADVLSAEKDFAAAAETLDKAITLAEEQESTNWNLYYQRGIAHERMKEWDKAEPDFKKALELSPNQPQVLNYLGYSWVDRNENLDEGLTMIKSAVELRPNDGYIIDSLGWAYYRLGRFDEAVDELERAVLITPMDPTINDHLGDAYWKVGRKREAKYQWERALIGDPKPEPDVVETINAKLENGLKPESERAEAKPPQDASKTAEATGEAGTAPQSGETSAPTTRD